MDVANLIGIIGVLIGAASAVFGIWAIREERRLKATREARLAHARVRLEQDYKKWIGIVGRIEGDKIIIPASSLYEWSPSQIDEFLAQMDPQTREQLAFELDSDLKSLPSFVEYRNANGSVDEIELDPESEESIRKFLAAVRTSERQPA
jgi:hypothetical protein